MKVLKFGGTSVGTPESLSNVRAIVEGQTEKCVVTVSALGGVTDRLIAAAEAAVGSDSWEEVYAELCERHRKVVRAVVAEARVEATLHKVESLLAALGEIFRAIRVLGELTERSRDLVVSFGERMSCEIVTAMISGAELAHSLEYIRTRRNFGKSVLDSDSTSRLIGAKFGSMGEANIIVVPGFISRDSDGRITNLGRGGSDYTAAILAAELGATELEIWTDVDGFMTADPRIVGDAQVIDALSFVEAMELCNFGAKVVYPPTIYPVFHKNIPIIIKNTFNPSAAGTLIGDTRGKEHKALGVSSIADMRLITIKEPSQYARMINSLTRNGIETFLPDGKESCGIRGGDRERAEAILAEEFAGEPAGKSIGISERQAMVALIGRGSRSESFSIGIGKALNAAGIPVTQTPQQVSEGSAACMIGSEDLKEALQVIHKKFIDSND